MKRYKITGTCIFIILLLKSSVAFSQLDEERLSVYFSLPEVALIDIEPGTNNDVQFRINSGMQSGESPTFEQSSADLWINYSSSLARSYNTRSIVAEVSQGALPEGIILYLEATNYSGNGGGHHGRSAGKIALTNRPKPIITDIGNCFTGDGVNNGHLLSFSIEISDYSKVVSVENSNMLVLYTITDN